MLSFVGIRKTEIGLNRVKRSEKNFQSCFQVKMKYRFSYIICPPLFFFYVWPFGIACKCATVTRLIDMEYEHSYLIICVVLLPMFSTLDDQCRLSCVVVEWQETRRVVDCYVAFCCQNSLNCVRLGSKPPTLKLS